MKESIVRLICNFLQCSPNNIVGLYPFGSRIYGNNVDTSDYDFICIVKDGPKETQILTPDVNVNIYRKNYVLTLYLKNDIKALEIACLPKDKILIDGRFCFCRNITELRGSISEKSSHSWVKAKKKFEKEQDIKAGKKSLFHSLRILDFGIQVAEKGRIENYGSMNTIYKEILEMESVIWDDYDKKYRELYNSMKTRFKAATSQTVEKIKVGK